MELSIDEGFVQINRTCIVNINVLESLRTMSGSRLEAHLDNKEKLVVSRKYLPGIRAAFGGEEE